MLAMGQNPSP